MTTKLDQIQTALDNLDIEQARNLLRQELQENPSGEAYYLASNVALNKQQKKEFLQKAVALDPFHISASKELEKLTQKTAAPIPQAAEKQAQPAFSHNTNTSGQGPQADVPPEIRGKWNWGAFWLTLFWGISHNSWLALLTFIPYVNFIVAIAFGIKGNEWGWRNRQWDSVEHFESVQKKWAQWGFGIVALAIFLGILIGLS